MLYIILLIIDKRNILLIYWFFSLLPARAIAPFQFYIGSTFVKPTYNLFSIPNRSNYLYNGFSISEVKVDNSILNAFGAKGYLDKKRKIIVGADFDLSTFRLKGPDIVDYDYFSCALKIYRAGFHINYAVIEGHTSSFFMGINLNRNIFKGFSVSNAQIEKYGNLKNTSLKLDLYRYSILPVNPELECLFRIKISPKKVKKSFIDIKSRIGLTAPLLMSLSIPSAQKSLFVYTPFHKSIQISIVHQFGK